MVKRQKFYFIKRLNCLNKNDFVEETSDEETKDLLKSLIYL